MYVCNMKDIAKRFDVTPSAVHHWVKQTYYPFPMPVLKGHKASPTPWGWTKEQNFYDVWDVIQWHEGWAEAKRQHIIEVHRNPTPKPKVPHVEDLQIQIDNLRAAIIQTGVRFPVRREVKHG